MSGDEESQKRIQFLRGRITILETQRSTPEETIRVKDTGLMQVQPTTSTYMTEATKPLLTLLTKGRMLRHRKHLKLQWLCMMQM
jgi:hypothetical protein